MPCQQKSDLTSALFLSLVRQAHYKFGEGLFIIWLSEEQVTLFICRKVIIQRRNRLEERILAFKICLLRCATCQQTNMILQGRILAFNISLLECARTNIALQGRILASTFPFLQCQRTNLNWICQKTMLRERRSNIMDRKTNWILVSVRWFFCFRCTVP